NTESPRSPAAPGSARPTILSAPATKSHHHAHNRDDVQNQDDQPKQRFHDVPPFGTWVRFTAYRNNRSKWGNLSKRATSGACIRRRYRIRKRFERHIRHLESDVYAILTSIGPVREFNLYYDDQIVKE